jgi:hypothetical protein
MQALIGRSAPDGTDLETGPWLYRALNTKCLSLKPLQPCVTADRPCGCRLQPWDAGADSGERFQDIEALA